MHARTHARTVPRAQDRLLMRTRTHAHSHTNAAAPLLRGREQPCPADSSTWWSAEVAVSVRHGVLGGRDWAAATARRRIAAGRAGATPPVPEEAPRHANSPACAVACAAFSAASDAGARSDATLRSALRPHHLPGRRRGGRGVQCVGEEARERPEEGGSANAGTRPLSIAAHWGVSPSTHRTLSSSIWLLCRRTGRGRRRRRAHGARLGSSACRKRRRRQRQQRWLRRRRRRRRRRP